MWQLFLEAYQAASAQPDTLFRRLRQAKINAVSTEDGHKILRSGYVRKKVTPQVH